MGRVPAGTPLLAAENLIGELLVDSRTARGRCFALEVQGDSMIDADIEDGDYVIVRQQQLAESGEIVVAMLEGEATVKRLHLAGDAIELRPENQSFSPIPIDPDHDFRILGKVVAVHHRNPGRAVDDGIADMNDRTPPPDAGPPDTFWEDELEMPVAALRATAESDDFMTEWLAERNGVQVAMLRHLLGLPRSSSTRSGREDLQGYLPALRRFVPVQRFARHKMKAAVIDFAERQLAPELMALATSGESYDPSALLYAVYDRDWRDLALFYQLEHVFRKGSPA